jgi:hypothetical protein
MSTFKFTDLLLSVLVDHLLLLDITFYKSFINNLTIQLPKAIYIYIHEYDDRIILLPDLQQVHILCQSNFSTECDLVLPLSITSILSFS